MSNNIIKKGFFLTVASLIVAVISFGREVIFANYFGVSEMSDAYTIAIQLPEVLFAAVWTAMNTVLIPMYQRVKQDGDEKKATCFLTTFSVAVLTLTVIFVVFGEVAADGFVYLFAPGFSKYAHELAVDILRWVFPIIVFEGVIRICSAVLHINNSFTIPKLLCSIRNIGVIFALLMFGKRFGVVAAAIGLLTGVILECIIAFCSSKKFVKLETPIDWKSSALREAGKRAVPIIIGTGVSELNQLADKIVASFLAVGSMVSLQYASKIEGIISTIFLYNIIALVFPSIAEAVAQKETEKASNLYINTIKTIIIIVLPIVLGAFLLGEELVAILFMRGEFDKQAVLTVAPLMSFYMLASLFNTVRHATVNVLAAYGKTKVIMFNTILSVILNICLNVGLSIAFGTTGIVIATCISSMIACVILLKYIHKSLFQIKIGVLFKLTAKALIATLLMGVIVILIKHWLVKFLPNIDGISLISVYISTIVVGALAYFTVHILLRTDIVCQFVRKIRPKL